MILLFPGRHQLLTNFQFQYIEQLLSNTSSVRDIDGNIVKTDAIEAVVFAVTSANHSNTRRNPLPFYLRALAIQEFSNKLNIPAYIYGIDDVGNLAGFASYTIKRIRHESEGLLDITRRTFLFSTYLLDVLMRGQSHGLGRGCGAWPRSHSRHLRGVLGAGNAPELFVAVGSSGSKVHFSPGNM